MQEFEAIISSLPPEMQVILRQLAVGGATLTGRELLGLITRLIALAASGVQRATIWRALMWLANAGRISLAALIEAAELMATGEGSSVVVAGAGGGAVGAGGGAATALASIVAFVLSVIVAMEAIAIAYFMISAEADMLASVAPQGMPCTGTGPTGVVFVKSVSRIGSRTSRNAAIRFADQHAKRVMTCSGGGGEDSHGGVCTAVAIPISVVPKYRVFWTTTTITYRVGCALI